MLKHRAKGSTHISSSVPELPVTIQLMASDELQVHHLRPMDALLKW